MNKYSLWIIPENEFYEEAEKIIAKYAAQYQTPTFPPHVTLCGSIAGEDEQVINAVKKIASLVKPFEIEIGPVEFSTTYFQCVFARMKTNSQLMNAHLKSREEFNIDEEHVYMPHASLVYGDFDMVTREKIAHEINIISNQFMAKKITIVRADSPVPKDWEIVAQIKL